ncbi:hypothetical protein J6590_037756 [Homalodisca vitripennis]|nr:hypothetical protein J6590_037756 [Homalodisca vitripennis]
MPNFAFIIGYNYNRILFVELKSFAVHSQGRGYKTATAAADREDGRHAARWCLRIAIPLPSDCPFPHPPSVLRKHRRPGRPSCRCLASLVARLTSRLGKWRNSVNTFVVFLYFGTLP